ncbi:HSP20-like chaperone [Tylopilus felleus]
MSRHPEVLWAQRSSSIALEKNIIYMTINVPDILESSLEYALTAKTLSFKATAGAERINYAFDLEFFAEIDPEQSTRRLTSRSLVAVLRKKEAKTEYWPRLTKEKSKTPFIKTDFSKWVDEDEQDGNPTIDDDLGVGGMPGMTDLDFSKMTEADFGGTPSSSTLVNEAESDDEDDGPPPLEEPEPAK